ncbi:hypothetical protein BDZ45DRAFT_715374 [Acephala macrosclerotiorum]|nr:hypothetical protein BDZ45DRAFT_715374 [Acephala macrosclerotiorum]
MRTACDVTAQTYKGNCHCGTFRFEIDAPPIKQVETCNCSICFKKGYLGIFLPEIYFRVTKGKENELTSYEFGAKTMPHKFCPVCGTGVMLRRIPAPSEHEEVYINIRALMDVNTSDLKIKMHNSHPPHCLMQGAFLLNLSDGYLPPADSQPTDTKVYTGGCHCGAVSLAPRSSLLSKVRVKEDNCSICRRNANVCIYPNKRHVSISGEENTTKYLFGQKFNGHCFCKTCRVPLFMRLHGPPKEVVDTWPEARQKMVKEKIEVIPIRVAVLDV